ncbi:flagellar hook-length control protein FliK [Shewanella salipaludis]|uniref:Flagellar hook-length control protein FliK n=1 Tax=Shewanella salipaludis TaxID=2723052 RepID=A0A972FTN5_9GAMM|nr:flagellar hook-length control protein FliK [Shewanella salipaludis]NMH65561.1 flagellar hook-length control protein FliK [Shewanella salipaludis]
MQQTTNILLAGSAKVTQSQVKNSQQPSDAEAFSTALAQAGGQTDASTQESGKSVLARAEATGPMQSQERQASANPGSDEEDSQNDDDIQLIFAQINLAKELRQPSQTAADGENLPLSPGNYADAASALTPGLSQESMAVAGGSADVGADAGTEMDDKVAGEASESVPALDGDSVAETQVLSGMAEAAELPIAAQGASPEAGQGADADAEQITSQTVQHMPQSASGANLTSESSLEPAPAGSGAGLSAGLSAGAMATPEVADAGGELASSQGLNPDPGPMAASATSTRAAAGAATTAASPGLEAMGAAKGDAALAMSGVSQEASLGNADKLTAIQTSDSAAQLREASLSVGLLTDAGEAPAVDGQNANPVDAKALQLQHLSAQGLLNRSEQAQMQLSLRHGGEQAPQMQEMIQRFSPVMKQQLIAMVSQGIQQAEIRLDPPELGAMMVKIQVQGDQTQVQFHVVHHQTRDLVEQAIPRLRELLSEQGMQLTDSQVSQGHGQQERRGSDDGGAGTGQGLDEISAEETVLSLNQATSSASGIDYYA